MQQENQPIELEDILAELKKLVDDYRENGVSKNTPFALKYGGNRGITRDPNTGALLESFPNKEDWRTPYDGIITEAFGQRIRPVEYLTVGFDKVKEVEKKLDKVRENMEANDISKIDDVNELLTFKIQLEERIAELLKNPKEPKNPLRPIEGKYMHFSYIDKGGKETAWMGIVADDLAEEEPFYVPFSVCVNNIIGGRPASSEERFEVNTHSDAEWDVIRYCTEQEIEIINKEMFENGYDYLPHCYEVVTEGQVGLYFDFPEAELTELSDGVFTLGGYKGYDKTLGYFVDSSDRAWSYFLPIAWNNTFLYTINKLKRCFSIQ